MSLKQLPFIAAVKLAKIDENVIIPTILFYDNKKPIVGRLARERCPSPELLIEEFKVDLGTNDPDAVSRKSSSTSHSPRRTPVGLAKDFFDETLRKVEGWLNLHGLSTPTRILIAEPLSLGGNELASESWLANYRRSIKRALPSRFVEVDFMPEPFAVFQYYRYGLRHPLVAEQRKHLALVLDFGGGTFDASVIETTKQGDISQSGVNSRPLGAKSIHVGGFYINRLIAEDALFFVLDKRQDKSSLRKSLDFFYANKNAGEDFLSTLSDAQRALFHNMQKLLQDVERVKLGICNGVANWRLEADLSGVVAYPITVPTNPFSLASPMANVRFDAGKLRAIYEDRVWKQKLKQTIVSTLERASTELRGQELSIVLLSGGSSNIRWLRPLLQRDLQPLLGSAQVLELSENFQEIVAKGLATECARRFFTEGQGDFRAVTYNRLCLALRADEGELEIRRLRPLPGASRPVADDVDDGVLLPAASSLRGLTDRPLGWKVRLSKPPKRVLDYYFLRSSFDPEDLDALHNVASTRVFTPTGVSFQQSIEVELTVRDDGTAEPKFYYGRDNFRPGTLVSGKPFYMDMTFAAEESLGETYLGFDFGTSTSSCSYVSSDDIQFINQRARTSDWRELTELVADLPYPTAAPLARYLSETDVDRRSELGREAAEAFLTLIAFITYSEYCVTVRNSAHLKGFQHRSAGPLWALIKSCSRSLPKEAAFAAAFVELVSISNLAQMDNWVSEIAAPKHGKLGSVDYVSLLSLLANTTAKALGDAQLGIFEDVTAKRFSQGRFTGIFRSLTGSGQPFIRVWEYEGTCPFSDAEVLLVHPERGLGLVLSPLYYWGLETPGAGGDVDLYEYDSPKGPDFDFKAVQRREAFRIQQASIFAEAWKQIVARRERDVQGAYVQDLILRSYEL